MQCEQIFQAFLKQYKSMGYIKQKAGYALLLYIGLNILFAQEASSFNSNGGCGSGMLPSWLCQEFFSQSFRGSASGWDVSVKYFGQTLSGLTIKPFLFLFVCCCLGPVALSALSKIVNSLRS